MLEEVDAGSEITKAKETNGIVFVTLAEAGSIDDATAAEHADLFAEWAYPVAYKVGQIRRYNGALYKCVQDHTSQAEWTPDTASSLWAGTSDPAEEWPAWSQPVGAHDAYSSGAKVSHNGKHWISSVDNNVWDPVCMDGRSRRNKCGRIQQLYCKETRPLSAFGIPINIPWALI